jgi:uncharacterized protein (DUF302 family)
MRKRLVITTLLSWLPLIAFATDGLVNTKSEAGSVKEVANRVEAVVKEKGLNLFSRIDHAKGAKKADLELRPTELLIFGNPKVGTPLMQCQQTAGIDLPQKILVWEDSDAQVWITYNDPNYLAQRHEITESCAETIAKVEKALSSITTAAAKPRKPANDKVEDEEPPIPPYHPTTCLSQIPDFSNHIVKLPMVTVDKTMVFNNVELTQSTNTGLFAISHFEDHHLNHTSTQLSGGQENPPIASAGSAEGLLKVDLRSGEISGMLKIMGLPEVTAAHIHQGTSDENGPIILPLEGDNTVRIIPPNTVLTPEQLSAYLDGNLYFNVHTPPNPAGELRGQIIPFSSPQFISVTHLSAAEVTETVTTEASGLGFLQVNLETGEVNGHITLTDVDATEVTAAHIHQGARGENGSIVIPLTANETNTRFDIQPATVMTPEQLDHLVREQLYFNVHTKDYPNGAIRGQIIPLMN